MVTGIPTEWGTCSRTVTFDHIPKGLACWKDLIAVGLGSGDIITFDGITGFSILSHLLIGWEPTCIWEF